MKKWAVSAIIYLLVVVAGYSVYASLTGQEKTDNAHKQTENHETEGHAADEHEGAHEEDHGGHGDHAAMESEVTAKAGVTNEEIIIELKDQQGNAVSDLEVNHEKLLHLIVVDDHLEQYVHLHPEQVKPGTFKIKHSLPEGSYKAFIDIKPKNLAYAVKPVPFTIGVEGKEHAHPQLTPDAVLEKEVDGYKVTLNSSEWKAGKDVTLTFNLHGKQVEPYLGAMGHVVILDESGEKYLHVHPANENETIFETSFEQPGIYKIWAEFKQNGKVRVFPFVVEVK
ncbi:hypothetical protein ACFOU2_00975 [Bacillus songklensis]|uniref:Secreted protein n=1 Tax=Bacillus songklensis TaxID=1069116 RepID=A0ABV8AX78_9BACI